VTGPGGARTEPEGPALVPDVARAWHALSAARVLRLLEADGEHGLAPEEAARRRARVGPNRVADTPERPLWRLAADQFRSLVVLLLLAAAAVAALLGEHAEALAISGALVANAAIGFGTEWRARRSLARLRDLVLPRARVRRGGRAVEIAAADLVPGDLVVLEAGSQVPADARLLRAAALTVDEAALTGESVPVLKDAEGSPALEAPLGDRVTMVYLGTTVAGGTGLAVVAATGPATELGRIGQLVAVAGDRVTPLERQVEGLGRRLIGLGLGVCAIVALVGIAHGHAIGLMLETAISLAVAAIPEGLPAVIAVALAGGLWRLARAGALVRRLPAVETLGSTTVICSDKTGTMTENRMVVRRLALDGRAIAVEGGTLDRAGRFTEDGRRIEPLADPDLARLLLAMTLVNDATLERHGQALRLLGDPTESALLVAAVKAGLDPAQLSRQWRRCQEVPFSPSTRLMATFNETAEGERAAFVKGAPGAVLDRCTHRQVGGERRIPSDEEREGLRQGNRRLAAEGLRVLAVAWHPGGWPDGDTLTGLTFLGFVAMEDPIRPGVQDAIARCQQAGIQTIMLTGDQRSTAEAVGRRLGLPAEAIRSRVSPEDKLDLIRALQGRGEVVAMTGDGVNDAPALVHADIGIAMGRGGTDVAREAADVVLTDDNFATIVRAVEDGRVIYANLQKVIRFLFSCNLSEIVAILVAVVAGLPAPLLPLQILWVNLVTDTLPAMALIRDPAEPDVMRRPPRDPRVALVTWRFGLATIAEGVLLAAGVLGAYLWVVAAEGPGRHASSVAFVALVLVHPLQAMHCRSPHVPWWRLAGNPLMGVSLVALVALQWGATAWAPLAGLLETMPLSAVDWLVVAISVAWPVALLEVVKVARAARGR
jgi:Ca2+-transporting ATPase